MKRTPLQRKTPLRRTWWDGKGRKHHTTAAWHRARQWTFDRAGGRCEAGCCDGCTGRAEHAHHLLMRSQGGPDDPSNLLAVCHACHRWIHDHPALAYEAGLLRRRTA